MQRWQRWWRDPATRRVRLTLGVLGWILVGVAAVTRQMYARSADFREFYLAARHLRGLGETSVIVPFSYPPTFHALITPLSWLPLGVAAAVWYVMCSAAAATAVWRLWRMAPERGVPVVPVLLSIGLILNDLVMGNTNLILLMCIAMAAEGLAGGRAARAGAAVMVGASLKLLPALLLPYVLIRGGWRAARGAMLAGVAAVVVPWVGLGSEVMRAWLEQLPGLIGLDEGSRWFGRGDVYRGTNQSLIAVLHRFLRPIPAIRGQEPMGTVNVLELPESTVDTLGAVLGLGVVLLVGWVWRRAAPRDGALVFGLMVIAMLWLSRITWVNYHVFLLIPHFAAWQALGEAQISAARRRWLWMGLGASGVCGVVGASAVTQALAVPMVGAGLLAVGLIGAVLQKDPPRG